MALQFLRKHGAAWGLIVFLAVLIFIPHSPAHIVDPGRDASTYLYVGNAVLEGQVPYRDAWDHKQPLTYFIHAAGLWIGGGSIWGMWVLECIFLSLTGVLSYSALNQVANRAVSFGLAAISLLTLSLMLWNYSTEELSLPFQLTALLCFIEFLKPSAGRRKKTWLSILTGASVSCAFFLKQNLVAAGAAILVFFFLRSIAARRWKDLVYIPIMAGGFALVALPILLYFYAHGALADYWDAAFLFNFLYSNLGLLERLRTMLDFLENLRTYPGFFLTFAVWIALLLVWIFQQGPRLARWLYHPWFRPAAFGSGAILLALCLLSVLLNSRQGFGLLKGAALAAGLLLIFTGVFVSRPTRRDWLSQKLTAAPILPSPAQDEPAALRQDLLGLAAVYFPAALLLMSLSGQVYVYYLISLYPAMVLILGLACGLLLEWANRVSARSILGIAYLSVGLALVYNPALQWLSDVQVKPDAPASAAIRYIQTTTQQSDPIYVWGNDVFFYFQTRRSAPTRYFDQIPLGWTGYGSRFSVVDEMVKAFQASKPALFVIPDQLLAPQAFGQCQSSLGDSALPPPVYAFLCSNYGVDKSFGHYVIYRVKK